MEQQNEGQQDECSSLVGSAARCVSAREGSASKSSQPIGSRARIDSGGTRRSDVQKGYSNVRSLSGAGDWYMSKLLIDSVQKSVVSCCNSALSGQRHFQKSLGGYAEQVLGANWGRADWSCHVQKSYIWSSVYVRRGVSVPSNQEQPSTDRIPLRCHRYAELEKGHLKGGHQNSMK